MEERGKDSRGGARDMKQQVGHWEMKAVCDLLADFFGVKAITWQSSSSKAES